MTGLRHSHFANINPCQCWVRICKNQHWLPSIWTLWLVVANFFAGETIVFTLQLGNSLTSESDCFATGQARGGRVRHHEKGTTIHGVGWTLVANGLLARGFCVCVCVCVCLSVVSISSKVSNGHLDLDIFQVLVRLLALLGILMDICRSRHTTCHSLKKWWDKLEFQLTDKGNFVVVQFWCQNLKLGPEAVEIFCHL